MAKIQDTYQTESEIPAELKTYYVLQNGVYVLDAQEETGRRLNPSVAANMQRLLDEKKEEKQKRQDAENHLNNVNTEVIALRTKVAGSNAVTPEEFAFLQKAKTFGTLPEAETMLTNFQTVNSELAAVKKTALLSEVAELSGFNPQVFIDLFSQSEKLKGIQRFFTEDETTDGKTVKKPFVEILIGEGKTEKKSVTDYVENTPSLSLYLNALKSTENNQSNGGGDQSDAGKKFLPQSLGSPKPNGGDKNDPVSAYLESMNKRAESGNPLIPATAPAK